MFQWFKNLLSRFGVDGAIALTIFSRLITAGGGLISIVFIARYLSGTEQGYYYTFSSIIAIQIFFELGLSSIITQFTAHEFAHLKLENNQLVGEIINKSRLSSLLRFCVKWFAIISCVLFFILVAAGYYFFSKYNQVNIDWQTPWIILCLSTALNLFIDPILAYFEGLGEIKDIARVRILQKSANIFLLFVFFFFGFKLYAAALASLISILINYLQILFSKRLSLLKVIWNCKDAWKVDYLKEIFPLQWKIALSWISGYLIFQMFNPVLFVTSGAVVAGQMGMTLTALNGISSISMSWIGTKVPMLSGFIARKEYDRLNTIFNKTLQNIVVVNLMLLAAFVAFVLGLKYFGLGLSNRFLPVLPIILLCLVTLINQYVFSWATYLRCHKEEPYLIISIVTGIMCCLSTLLLGKYFSLMGIVTGYFLITAIITFPWAYKVFTSKKRLWH